MYFSVFYLSGPCPFVIYMNIDFILAFGIFLFEVKLLWRHDPLPTFNKRFLFFFFFAGREDV